MAPNPPLQRDASTLGIDMTLATRPHLKTAILLVLSLTLISCGIVGPKIEFYDSSIALKDTTAAKIVGSKSLGQKPLSPVLVYLGSIDGKATGRANAARCNFNSPYSITPGPHHLLVAISAGEMFATSRFGYVSVQIEVQPSSRLTVQGEVLAANSALLWVTNEEGKVVLEKTAVVLKDSPSKGMPLGFAMIEDSCAIP